MTNHGSSHACTILVRSSNRNIAIGEAALCTLDSWPLSTQGYLALIGRTSRAHHVSCGLCSLIILEDVFCTITDMPEA